MKEAVLIDFTNEIAVSSPPPISPTLFPNQRQSMPTSSSLVDLTVPNSVSNLCCVDRKSSPEYDTSSTYSAGASVDPDRYYNVPPSNLTLSSDRYYSVVPSFDNPDHASRTSNYYSPVTETSPSLLAPPTNNLTRMGSCPALHVEPNHTYRNVYQPNINGSRSPNSISAFDDLLENFGNMSFQPAQNKFPTNTRCQTATTCDRNQMLEELRKTLGMKEMHQNFAKDVNAKPVCKIPLLQPPQQHAKRNNRLSDPSGTPSFPRDVPPPPSILPSPPPVPLLPPNTAEVKPFVINNPVSSKSNLSPNSSAFNFFPKPPSSNSALLRRQLGFIQAQVSGVTMDECQASYQQHNGNVEAIVRDLQLMQLCRLGIASKPQCEAALKAAGWNVELAASSLLDSV